MMRLRDFYVKERGSDFETILDVDSLMELFDGDFIKLQESEMQAHFDFLNSRGVFEIKCHDCRSFIEGPKDLVRYFGANLCNKCFKDNYPYEKQKLNDVEKKYFDRVYSLIILGDRESLF